MSAFPLFPAEPECSGKNRSPVELTAATAFGLLDGVDLPAHFSGNRLPGPD